MGDVAIWALPGGALVLGGLVKGALGVGLPLVAVPLLALWLPPAQAIGLLADADGDRSVTEQLEEGNRLLFQAARAAALARVSSGTVSFPASITTWDPGMALAWSQMSVLAAL